MFLSKGSAWDLAILVSAVSVSAKLQCKIFWEGTGFETSQSLTLLYADIESPKCLSQPSPWAPRWLCPSGQSGMLWDDTQDKGYWCLCPPHYFCILLRLITLLLVLELLSYTFWGPLVSSQSPRPAPPL